MPSQLLLPNAISIAIGEKLTFRKKIIQKFNLRSNWSLFWSSESSKIKIWVSWTVYLLVTVYGLSDKPIYVFTLYSLKGLWGEYRRFPQPAHVNHN